MKLLIERKRELEELLHCAIQNIRGEGRRGSYESEKIVTNNVRRFVVTLSPRFLSVTSYNNQIGQI